ncbi:MAG: S41 family peptidase [Phycisphaerae bacterium]|jgi:carboxyl-terminal processing protease
MTKRNMIWVASLLVVAVAMFWVAQRPRPLPITPEPSAPLEGLQGVYHVLKDSSYRPLDDATLLRGAISGMVSAIDEFSSYVPDGKVDSFQRRMDGTEVSTGISLISRHGQLRVLKASYGSPAQQAGIVGGETLLAIDGRPTDNMTVAEARIAINSGPPGTSVKLSLSRPAAETAPAASRSQTLEIARKELTVESVRGLYRDEAGRWVYDLGGKMPAAYVRLCEFVPTTSEQLQMALRQVEAMRGLVLDLRGNPGGRLPSAIEVADLFQREGPIVTIAGRDGSTRLCQARAEGNFPDDIRIVVLIDAETASAAEIVAGSLQAARRAVVVGTRSRGKGCIQTMIPLPGHLGQVNLTTGEFFIGKGRPLGRQPGSDRWGVDPDVEVTVSAPQAERMMHLWALAEMPAQDLPQPATAPATRPGATRAASMLPGESSMAQRSIHGDRQLARAVELLADPEQMDEILKQAQETTQPASQPVGAEATPASRPGT